MIGWKVRHPLLMSGVWWWIRDLFDWLTESLGIETRVVEIPWWISGCMTSTCSVSAKLFTAEPTVIRTGGGGWGFQQSYACVRLSENGWIFWQVLLLGPLILLDAKTRWNLRWNESPHDVEFGDLRSWVYVEKQQEWQYSRAAAPTRFCFDPLNCE